MIRDFKHLSGQSYEIELAKSLLEEIPKQVVEYFRAIGIMPNPPQPVSPPPPYEA
jgi:hypothetical protein